MKKIIVIFMLLGVMAFAASCMGNGVPTSTPGATATTSMPTAMPSAITTTAAPTGETNTTLPGETSMKPTGTAGEQTSPSATE